MAAIEYSGEACFVTNVPSLALMSSTSFCKSASGAISTILLFFRAAAGCCAAGAGAAVVAAVGVLSAEPELEAAVVAAGV